ncbi:MAG: hypothetical protein A3I77_00090 [Gammaproteobacteria bacterium RIFCSPLOWO2_02_FULL_42_14]|nr:MAG: hypothetical protein A3B71_00090 [Gammaproteobacteria bacterium RIFCSPHIGHO2_02_FULL_42_43]OGT28056.1 MAG: hypothetical protein A2624_03245 [Gammaproteobacteria bacterium RIFCSPHIGHO2_01_FULL_42_8]OGT51893.1 MAG: hypothetical protein A3E54_01115 [Gammaproteobacteria bacterium RIFCSPHIGHO2_12_FULL_41_25]OGT62407.1 MAG: hypothetical protein A3I77_00090 [Gammaproteobacteria bacterium RIFCSPLOWO2_02_FULL_42_14]OGT85359.1 MAG: hypothetical protein A3G86_08040 [Gammaproteobacteria bacterium R
MSDIISTHNGFSLQGKVSFDNVLALRLQGEALIRQNCTIDLSHIAGMDAAIFSLLLCWKRWANARRVTVHFIHAPASIKKMSVLFSLTQLLEI